MADWFRRARHGDGAASGMLGDLIEVFQPSRRHVEEERERRQEHAVIPEAGAPPFHVDLDRGLAYLPGPVPADGASGADGEDGGSPPTERAASAADGDVPTDPARGALGT